MDVEPCPALQAQRKAHPEMGEKLDKLQKYKDEKLYHQLTQTILDYLASPPLVAASAASELLEFFNAFIKPFEKKFSKTKWVQILGIVCKPQKHEVALELIAPFEEHISTDRDAKYLFQALKAEKQVHAKQYDEAKELLEALGNEISDAYEVDAHVQSQFHKTNALLWKNLGVWKDFYKSSILYLAFTPLAAILPEERPQLAYEVVVAALVAEEEFNFGELTQQEILKSLDGSPYEWIKDLLHAFGEGKFDLFDAAFSKHRARIDGAPELKNAETSILAPKIRALALMELAFRKITTLKTQDNDIKQRRLSFDEIAQHCRVQPKEVEYLVMKAMCADLIKGKVDEVAQIVLVTWVKPRILDKARIEMMRLRMDEWSQKTGILLNNVEEMTPELLVS